MSKFKSLSMLCAIIIATLFAGCGETGNNANTEATNKDTTTTAQTTTEETTTTPKVTTTKKTTTTTVTTTALPYVSYISDRSVQFNDAENKFEVLFGLEDQNKEYMKSKAEATIVIVNDNGNEVYNKTVQITEKDFSNWSNTFRDDNRLLCCVEIPIDDITPDSVKMGKLTLSVKGDGFTFDESSYNIRYLPIRTMQIALPAVPIQVSKLTYKGEIDTTVEVSEITQTSDDSSVTLKFKCTLVYNRDGSNEATSGRFAYRLIDKDGVIADTGNVYTNAIRLGETTYAEKKFYSFNLDFSQDYTLELWNDE